MFLRLSFFILLCLTRGYSQTAKIGHRWTSSADSILIKTAVAYFEVSKYKEGLREISRVTEATKRLPETRFLSAVSHFHLKKYDLALAELQEVIQRAPENIEPYYFRGLIFFQKKHYAEAANDLIRCKRVWPYNEKISAALRLSLANDPVRDSTIAALAATVDTDTVAAIMVAEYYLFTGSPQKTIRTLEPVLVHHPEFFRAWETISFAFGLRKNYGKAIASIDKVLDAKPHYGRGHYLKGWYIYDSGKKEAAQPSLAKAKQYGYDWQDN